MEEKNIICIVCPVSCRVTVRGTPEHIEAVTGCRCRRGEQYARNEFCHPVRVLTTSVRVMYAGIPLVPVRSSIPIARELMLSCVDCLRSLAVLAPIRRGDILLANILGTGADIVATSNVDL